MLKWRRIALRAGANGGDRTWGGEGREKEVREGEVKRGNTTVCWICLNTCRRIFRIFYQITMDCDDENFGN